MQPAWTLPSGVSIIIKSDSDFITFGDLFLSEEYDEAITRLLRGCRGNAYVVDLGANVGFFYLRLAHLFLTERAAQNVNLSYIAVEPNSYCFRELSDAVKRNGNVFESVELLDGLVGLKCGTANFLASSFHIGSRVSGGGKQQIPYIDISRHLTAKQKIGLLKIDIEGSEELFLENYGELLKATQTVIIEIHENLCNSQRCRELLAASGLRQESKRHATEHFVVELWIREGMSPLAR